MSISRETFKVLEEETGLKAPNRRKNKITVTHGTRTQALDVSKWTILEERTGAAGEQVIKFQDPAGTIINANETTEKGVFNIHKEKTTPLNPILLNPEAEKILLDPQLLQILKSEVAKKVVGEEDSIHTIILTVAGALWIAEQTPPTYTLVTNSKSNAGKDHTVSKTLDLFPTDRIFRRTRISERALTYLHNNRYEPEWTWDNKILYLSDVSNAVLNCEVLKCMVTEGSNATIVINHMAIDIEIKGKPGIIGTIANASPAEETLGRFPFMALDETAEQTKAIMQRQAQAAAQGKKLNSTYSQDVLDALKLLEPVTVVIPYAEKLPEKFNTKSVIMRRNFDRILKYIMASAALHQRQRKRDEFGSIIAEPADYENAAQALRKIASNAALVPLTREDKEIIEYALTVDSFTTMDAATAVPGLQRTALYEHLDKLSSYGLLHMETQKQTFGRPVKLYKAAPQDTYTVKIPTWKEIEEKATYSALSGCPLQKCTAKDNNSPNENHQNEQPAEKNGKSGQANKAEQVEIAEKVGDKFGYFYFDKVISHLKSYPGGLPKEDLLSLFPEKKRPTLSGWIDLWLEKGDLRQPEPGRVAL